MLPGDILGHETMGEVVEVGGGANGKLKKGDRIVVPFTITCGECEQCRAGNFSCCERSNRKKYLADRVFGHGMAGLFGYTHLTGGYPGGQAEYLRVPFADTTHIKVPDGIPDEKLLFLSDIFPTGWQAAVQADIEPSDTVAIWGCGPVGQMTIRSAILLDAEHVVAIDNVPERLEMAEAGGAITINFDTESVYERLNELTDGKGRRSASIASALKLTSLPRCRTRSSTAPSRWSASRPTGRTSFARWSIAVGRLGCCRSRASTSALTTRFRWAC
jgi:threonine dehydrogenase-like Zn-dependent dehydrogenase